VKERRVVYPTVGGQAVSRLSDLTYRVVGDEELKLDVYRPATRPAHLPAVVFIHGDGPPEVLGDIKDWGQYVSWGELTASTGIAAVTFNHRSSYRRTRMHEVAGDIEAGVDYVTGHAEEWGLDASTIGLWTCSMGAPFALRLAFARSSSLRCVVALYGAMDLTNDPGTDESVPEEVRREFSPLQHLRAGGDLPPLLLARAGKDHPWLNASIDAFVARALDRNLEIDLLNHPTGEHGFDVLNDCRRSREVIEATLGFFRRHL
jgi:acetyl esterase/lipase